MNWRGKTPYGSPPVMSTLATFDRPQFGTVPPAYLAIARQTTPLCTLRDSIACCLARRVRSFTSGRVASDTVLRTRRAPRTCRPAVSTGIRDAVRRTRFRRMRPQRRRRLRPACPRPRRVRSPCEWLPRDHRIPETLSAPQEPSPGTRHRSDNRAGSHRSCARGRIQTVSRGRAESPPCSCRSVPENTASAAACAPLIPSG